MLRENHNPTHANNHKAQKSKNANTPQEKQVQSKARPKQLLSKELN